MLCARARTRLVECGWRLAEYSQDRELMEHLSSCSECRSLVRAEEILRADMAAIRQAQPEGELSLQKVREIAEQAVDQGARIPLRNPARSRQFSLGYRLAFAGVALVIIVLSLIPFSFTEKVGYEIAIGGVDKAVALDNQKITSLLGALGMEQAKATTLLDSLDKSEIRLYVGECSETCRLTISDLKTEKDVRLMVKAIIDLGCCQIDKIAPIFRHESTSLLALAAKKLLS